MASRAEKNRQKKAKTAAASQGRPPGVPAPVVVPRAAPAGYQRRKSGLEWLSDKGRISPRERRAGDRYGQLWRLAQLESGASIKSCLDDSGGGGGGGAKGGGLPAGDDYTVLVVEARQAMDHAQIVLGYHSGMVACCELICGRGMTPREITKEQREADEIETALRIALQILVRAWGL